MEVPSRIYSVSSGKVSYVNSYIEDNIEGSEFSGGEEAVGSMQVYNLE